MCYDKLSFYSSLCKNFDGRLSNLQEDTNHYLVDQEKQNKPRSILAEPEKTDKNIAVFDRFADNKELQIYVQSACEAAIQK